MKSLTEFLINESTELPVKPGVKVPDGWAGKELIEKYIKQLGPKADLNFLDVSEVTDMSLWFNQSNFNGDISKWNVSNVKDMCHMFNKSKFNGDISKWDVSNVEDMSFMFQDSIFNGDISKWDVSNVKNMEKMFRNSKFNGDISKWDIRNDCETDDMFEGTSREKRSKKQSLITLDSAYSAYEIMKVFANANPNNLSDDDYFVLNNNGFNVNEINPNILKKFSDLCKKIMKNNIVKVYFDKPNDYAGYKDLESRSSNIARSMKKLGIESGNCHLYYTTDADARNGDFLRLVANSPSGERLIKEFESLVQSENPKDIQIEYIP